MVVLFWVLAGFFAGGVISLWRRNRWLAVLLGMIAVFFAGVAVAW